LFLQLSASPSNELDILIKNHESIFLDHELGYLLDIFRATQTITKFDARQHFNRNFLTLRLMEKIALTFPMLETIILFGPIVTLDILRPLTTLKSLTALDISNTPKIGKGAAEIFSSLKNLKYLNVGQCRGVTEMTEIISACPKLKHLDLNGCDLPESSWKVLSNCRSLEYLDISMIRPPVMVMIYEEQQLT
jgi:hypothetical protein